MVDRVLSSIFYNAKSPASYSGVSKLYSVGKKRLPKLKIGDVQKWLSLQDVYTLHKPVITKYARQPTRVIGYGTTLFTDLASFEKLSHYNKNHNWLLVVVEALSRKAYVEPLKHKTAIEVLEAFKRIYVRLPTTPFRILSDQGKEYENQFFREFCKSVRLVHVISSNIESHAWLAERFIRTIKGKLYKYFTDQGTKTWIDVVQDFVASYNNTLHRSIGVSPNTINLKNEELYIGRADENAKKLIAVAKYRVGDIVRIALSKPTFHKGYKQTHADPLYRVSKILNRVGPPCYEIAEYETGTVMSGIWYERELSKTTIDRETVRKNKYKRAKYSK